MKLWLTAAQTLSAIGPATYDDRLFLRLAQSIRAGNWLGPFDNLTLAKGPAYSVWIALISGTHLPLLLAQHLLYAAACALLVVALRPLIPRRGVLFGIYGLLLFNPMTYTSTVLRVTREGIYPAETLFLIACLVGVHTRRDRSLRILASWSAGLGLALAAFWLTREEAVWIVPTMALLLGWTGVRLWIERGAGRGPRLALCALPLAFWGVALAGVSALNHGHYGVFTTCEFRWQGYLSAYGALTRVTQADGHREVPLPRETRLRIYAVSPAFKELEPHLEGERGLFWASTGADFLPHGTQWPEIAGGWFAWAFRDAVAMAGHYRSGEAAHRYYARLADEVNRACETGLLPAGRRRATVLPTLGRAHLPLLLRAGLRGAGFLAGFRDFDVTTLPSIGPEPLLELFREMTGERLAALYSRGDSPVVLDRARLAVLRGVGSIYSLAVPWLSIGAVASFAFALLRARGVASYADVLAAALLLAIGIRILLLAWIDVSSFPAIDSLYLTPLYPLLLLFIGIEANRLTSSPDRELLPRPRRTEPGLPRSRRDRPRDAREAARARRAPARATTGRSRGSPGVRSA